MAPNVNLEHQEQEVEKPEVLEQEVKEQEDVQDDKIQKRETSDLIEDYAIDPEQEEFQKKIVQSKIYFLHILTKKSCINGNNK